MRKSLERLRGTKQSWQVHSLLPRSGQQWCKAEVCRGFERPQEGSSSDVLIPDCWHCKLAPAEKHENLKCNCVALLIGAGCDRSLGAGGGGRTHQGRPKSKTSITRTEWKLNPVKCHRAGLFVLETFGLVYQDGYDGFNRKSLIWAFTQRNARYWKRISQIFFWGEGTFASNSCSWLCVHLRIKRLTWRNCELIDL